LAERSGYRAQAALRNDGKCEPSSRGNAPARAATILNALLLLSTLLILSVRVNVKPLPSNKVDSDLA